MNGHHIVLLIILKREVAKSLGLNDSLHIYAESKRQLTVDKKKMQLYTNNKINIKCI